MIAMLISGGDVPAGECPVAVHSYSSDVLHCMCLLYTNLWMNELRFYVAI